MKYIILSLLVISCSSENPSSTRSRSASMANKTEQKNAKSTDQTNEDVKSDAAQTEIPTPDNPQCH